jgi:hypothetical protein
MAVTETARWPARSAADAWRVPSWRGAGHPAGRRPTAVVTFGYSDDEAFAVGLTCGGTIHLFIEPLDW